MLAVGGVPEWAKPDCRCLGSLACQYLKKYMKCSKISFGTETMSSPRKPWYMAAFFVGLQHSILGLSLAIEITCVFLKISSLQRDFLRRHNPGNPHFYTRCAKSEVEAGENREFWGRGSRMWDRRVREGSPALFAQDSNKLPIFGWVVGLISNLQLCWKNIFKSYELLSKRLLLMVLTLGVLCYSLIQNPNSINTQHTWVFPYPNSFVMSLIRKYLSQLRFIGEVAELPCFL